MNDEQIIIDGRKARWFDCNRNNESSVPMACEKCIVCRYLNFLDFAESVGKPECSVIDYNRRLGNYLRLKTIKDKQLFISTF